jgi:hypothetical protein
MVLRTVIIRSAFAFSLTLAVVGFACNFGGVELRPAPDFQPGTLTFHDASVSEVLRGAFRFSNPTSVPIRILEIESSCSCTVTDNGLVGQEVPPGGSTKVPVTFKVGPEEGTSSSKITLHYEDVGGVNRTRGFRTAVVRAEIISDFRASVSLVDFGAVDDESSITRTIRVKRRKGAEGSSAVKGLTTSNPCFRPTIIDPGDGDGDGVVMIRFDGSELNRSGAISGVVRVKTGSPKTPEVSIISRALYRSAVEVTPTAVVITKSGLVPDQIAQVSTKYPSIIKVLGASRPGIQIFADQAEEATTHKLTIHFGPDAPDGFDDELRLRVRIAKPDGAVHSRSTTLPIHRIRLAGLANE